MNTALSTKFTAFVLALAINGLILGGVAVMFNPHLNDLTAAVAAKSPTLVSAIA